MPWQVAQLALAVIAATTGHPTIGSPAHRIELAPERPSNAPPDGWRQRVLVHAQDGSVRVAGPIAAGATPCRSTPKLDASDALTAVARAGWPGAPEPTLVCTDHGRLAWRVDPPPRDSSLANPVFLVDAARGTVRLRHDRSRHATITAFDQNPVATPRVQSFELTDFDPDAADGDLLGERVAVFNCVAPVGEAICGFATVPPSDAEGNFAHPAPDVTNPADNTAIEDGFSVQSVHHHASVFLDYVASLGLPPLACDGAAGTPLTLVANYKAHVDGEPVLLGNATYVGDCTLYAAFGQGTKADYGYDGDVVYHELAHGVVEAQMGGRFLGRTRVRSDAVLRDAAAMNEGMADFLAATLTGNAAHAEYVAFAKGVPGRNLDNDLACPEALAGESHDDGEMWGGLLWALYLDLGEPFVLAALDAIALLQEDSSFEEGAQTLVAVVTEELGADAGARAEAEASARGLMDCVRIVPWDRVQRALWLRPRGHGGAFSPMQPPPAQVEVALPPGAVGFWLRAGVEIRPSQGFAPTTELHALVRHGEPIAFAFATDADGDFTVEADVDAHLPVIEEALLGDGLYVEAPGDQTTYLGLFNQSANATLVSQLDVEIVMGEVEGGSTGDGTDESGGPAADDGTDESGGPTLDSVDSSCACRSQPRRGEAPWWLLAWLAVVRRRDRRRGEVSTPSRSHLNPTDRGATTR